MVMMPDQVDPSDIVVEPQSDGSWLFYSNRENGFGRWCVYKTDEGAMKINLDKTLGPDRNIYKQVFHEQLQLCEEGLRILSSDADLTMEEFVKQLEGKVTP